MTTQQVDDRISPNRVSVGKMRSITKVYPDGTVALRGANFDFVASEIHGLLGENGAGKTTLMKILSGLLRPTEGEIYLRGQPVRFKSPLDALRAGIGIIHQHFALVPTFTALENIVLGQENGGSFSLLDEKQAKDRLMAVMEEGGLRAPLDVPVELLPVGVQQRVEILKQLYRDVDILILDEPTSVLTPIEVEELFQMLKKFKRTGKTVIFITHKLKEVLEITDRITVLRGGQVVGNVPTVETTPQKLATMMVGREVLPSVKKEEATPGEPVLTVENLQVVDDLDSLAVNDISFEVRAGEIFGIAGVEGNGQTELVEALTGLRAPLNGRVSIDDTDISGKGPRDLYRLGLAHIPEDRRKLGLILDFSVAEDSILGTHRDMRFRSSLRNLLWNRIYDYARRLIRRFAIIAPSVRTQVKSLSGGNQQKLVVGRELDKRPKLVVAAQPTRGLDVAATQYIRDLLVNIRDERKAILLVSADLDEVMQLSDRIAVIYEGEFLNILEAEVFDREQIGMMMGGVKGVGEEIGETETAGQVDVDKERAR
ncbi:MAG: ABC transporter ATP-binding protein [Candidatus Bipolaricaulia bacterium]